MTTNERTVGRYLGWVLAALSLGAGVIHFAVSGEHYNLSLLHGTFFAVTAWLQLSYAVAVIIRPNKLLLQAGVFLNAGIVGVWVMSRVWGVPIGPEAWTPEAVGLADLLSTGFEVGIVALSLGVLVRPALAQQRLRPTFAYPVVGAAALGVAVVSSMAVAPAFASGHHHGDTVAADGHTHSHSAAAGGHTHPAIVSNAPRGDTPCEQSGPPASAGQISSAGGHGHRGPTQWTPIVDRATREQLGQQLEIAHQVTLQYPTVADAEAAGYNMVTGYVPCIGAHYIKASNMIGGFDPAKPSMLLYDGTNPDSKMVGLSYSVLGDPNTPPEGFAGPNDPWHKHDSNGGLCMKGGVVVGAESTSDAECAARGGKKVALHNLWMMHAWTADAWPSSWGLFSAENPELGGKIGDVNATPDAASRKQLANTAVRE
ncbi:MAG TPA: hypothetical protein VGO38_06280 [Acidimicrobiia bacterium]|jgi:hypothetical protein